jgi:hypothetical protein
MRAKKIVPASAASDAAACGAAASGGAATLGAAASGGAADPLGLGLDGAVAPQQRLLHPRQRRAVVLLARRAFSTAAANPRQRRAGGGARMGADESKHAFRPLLEIRRAALFRMRASAGAS